MVYIWVFLSVWAQEGNISTIIWIDCEHENLKKYMNRTSGESDGDIYKGSH